MKTNPKKVLGLLFTVSIIAVIGLSNCGQEKNSNNNSDTELEGDETTVDTNDFVDTPATVTIDSLIDISRQSIDEGQPVKKESSVDSKAKKGAVKAEEVDDVIDDDLYSDEDTGEDTYTDEATPMPAEPMGDTDNKIDQTKTPSKTEVPIKTDEIPNKDPDPVIINTPDENEWVVLANYKKLTNPYPVDKATLSLGKRLYGKHCKSCHGASGDGQGNKAASLDTEVKPFQRPEFQSQKPGEIFYKTFKGRDEMPSFEKKILDKEDRWSVIEYVISLR